jgi:exodeoxyribonuclease VII large subunit
MAMTVLRVSQLNRYVKSILDATAPLREVYVRGEIANFAPSHAGHLYFSLRDEAASVRAVMFSKNSQLLRFMPENAMRVVARATATLYEADGSFQLVVMELLPDGAGALGVAYEQLRRRLEQEGLFDARRKRPIPKYPAVIGVVTSPVGAAFQDICSVLERRYPIARVLLAPAVVQGKDAAPSIAAAIGRINKDGRSDVLIVGRGGGSLEELWAFNEEITVRAVANSKIPVVSAVGHQTDVTLCDFAADMRAETPTAAVELVCEDKTQMLAKLSAYRVRLRQDAQNGLLDRKSRLNMLAAAPAMKNPTFFIEKNRQILKILIESMYKHSLEIQKRSKSDLSARAALLDSLSPLRILSRGYSLTQSKEALVTSTDEVRNGDALTTRVTDGKIFSVVTGTEKGVTS